MSREQEGEAGFAHKPEPGYRTIFYVVFGIAAVYLVIIMGATF